MNTSHTPTLNDEVRAMMDALNHHVARGEYHSAMKLLPRIGQALDMLATGISLLPPQPEAFHPKPWPLPLDRN